MDIFNKPFTEINFADVNALVIRQTLENQSLEYKKIPWTKDNAGKRELLRDISAMANAYGGYIIIGVEEDKADQAIAFANVQNSEDEQDRIVSMVHANLQPRIAGFNIKCLTDGTTNIILIYAPHSLRTPHLITGEDLYQFWIRHDRQKAKMSVEEIRDAILKNVGVSESVSTYLEKRKLDYMREIVQRPFVVVRAIPSEINQEFVNTRDPVLRDLLKRPLNLRPHGWDFHFNRDAKPTLLGLKIDKGMDGKQLELHRNGYVEGRASMYEHEVSQDKKIDGETHHAIRGLPVVEYVYSFINQAKQIFDYANYEGQVLIQVSLVNIKNYQLGRYQDQTMFQEYSPWKQDFLDIGPLAFDILDPDKITQTLTDRVWEAFGFEQAPYFEDSKFTVPK